MGDVNNVNATCTKGMDIPLDQCTLDTCCIDRSPFTYRVSLPANAIFVIIFLAIIIPQLGLGLWKRTWGFLVGMLLGLLLEAAGYAGRVILSNNPFSTGGFSLYFIAITVAPVFITASIYLTLSRIIVLYGEHLSFFKPRTVAIVFMIADILSLVLQALGAGVADANKNDPDPNKSKTGIDVMIGGLVWQCVSLAIFLTYMLYFFVKCRSGRLNNNPSKEAARRRGYFKFFLVMLVITTLAILARSIYRVAELWQGFRGDLWNSELDFMILDSVMMALSVIFLTIAHPGLAFGKQWAASNWSFRGRKKNQDQDTSDDELEKPVPSAPYPPEPNPRVDPHMSHYYGQERL